MHTGQPPNVVLELGATNRACLQVTCQSGRQRKPIVRPRICHLASLRRNGVQSAPSDPRAAPRSATAPESTPASTFGQSEPATDTVPQHAKIVAAWPDASIHRSRARGSTGSSRRLRIGLGTRPAANAIKHTQASRGNRNGQGVVLEHGTTAESRLHTTQLVGKARGEAACCVGVPVVGPITPRKLLLSSHCYAHDGASSVPRMQLLDPRHCLIYSVNDDTSPANWRRDS